MTRTLGPSLVVAAVMAAGFHTVALAAAPKIVDTTPSIGATDVDPAMEEIRVTFDQPMAGGFSWTGGGEEFPKVTENPSWSADKKTCVLPVKLEEGHFYRVGINSSSHRNFKNASGEPAEFGVIYFATSGASDAVTAKAQAPNALNMVPHNGASDVDPSTDKIVVTFDQPMGPGFSWTNVPGTQPEITGKPTWNDDRTVCTLPIKVEPDTTYTIGLNHPFANNFQSAHGVPLKPVVWTFSTR